MTKYRVVRLEDSIKNSDNQKHYWYKLQKYDGFLYGWNYVHGEWFEDDESASKQLYSYARDTERINKKTTISEFKI